MARKDEILSSFLQHEMLVSRYGLSKDQIPSTVREGLDSSVPIIKAISLIVDALESHVPITDAALRNQVTQFLNESI
jgi:hypothetical protein